MALLGLRTPPHQNCRGSGAGRYVKSFHLFGWRVCLALPGCHLHVVHGVSTPYEEAKNSPICTYTTNLQTHSRGGAGSAGGAPTKRISRASPNSVSLVVLRLIKVGVTISKGGGGGGVRRLAKGGATISNRGCDE